MPQFLFESKPSQEMIDWIATQPVVSRRIFDELLPELQARAFTISGVESANVLQNVRDIIAGLPQGVPWPELRDQITSILTPWLGDEETAQARAELLLRVHGQEAYMAARWREMKEVEKYFPYWQYMTLGDDRVRPGHAALHGLVLPSNSVFWDTHFPPWEWGCRCTVIAMSESSIEQLRETEKDLPPEEQKVWLDGPLLKELELNNRVVRGMNKIFNVAPPTGPGAYRFDPSTLRITADQLKARYDEEVWAFFEDWAKQTELAPGRTVWGWISGEEAAAAIAAAPFPIEQQIATNTIESAYVIDQLGNVIMSKIGTQDSVEFTTAEMRQMENAIVTHNHPSGGAFSDLDVEFAFRVNVSELRAIGQTADGRKFLYQLIRPSGGWSLADLEHVLRDYQLINAGVTEEFDAAVASGEMTESAARLELYHEVMKRLAEKYPGKFDYERTEL